MSRGRYAAARIAALVAKIRPATGDPQRVLLIRPDHLGDLLFVTPSLRFLRQAMPEAHLALLVGPWSRPAIAHNPNLDEILECDFPWFNRKPASALVAYPQLWREAGHLRSKRFGVAVNLRPDFAWGAMLAATAGIPRRVGFDVSDVRPSLTQSLDFQPDSHAVIQNLRLAEAIAGTSAIEIHPLEFVIPPEAQVWAGYFLTQEGISPNEKLVAIQPGSGAPVKGWTAEGFATVATYLQRTYEAHIVITGSAGERPLAEAIAARMETQPTITAGATNLDQLAALLQRCALAVGVDSGPLHLAVAVGTPTVHLFGPANSSVYGPWGAPDRHKVVRSKLSCVPCEDLSRPAPGSRVADCMRAIESGMVIETIDSVLEATRSAQ